jgi:hypothetical protein
VCLHYYARKVEFLHGRKAALAIARQPDGHAPVKEVFGTRQMIPQRVDGRGEIRVVNDEIRAVEATLHPTGLIGGAFGPLLERLANFFGCCDRA